MQAVQVEQVEQAGQAWHIAALGLLFYVQMCYWLARSVASPL
ncbi:hypothetical protein [Paenibacillus sp. 481]|nr:hypothetical protein [Paenibacillus sp. 481]